MHKFTDAEIAAYLEDIQAGDGSALERLYAAYTPVLDAIARKAPAPEMEDARSMASVAFMEAVRDLPADTDRVSTALYLRVKNATTGAALEDRTVTLPGRTAGRYVAILKAHDGDTSAAYAACAAGQESMDATTFLAAHVANYAHVDRESIGPAPESGEDVPAVFQMAVEDDIESVDTHDLVHNHLLPLCDDAAHEGVIVRLAYGFTDVSDAVADRLAEAGFQPGDILTDIESSEVLATPGLGSRTVGKRRRAALARMREYLECDAVNEGAEG